MARETRAKGIIVCPAKPAVEVWVTEDEIRRVIQAFRAKGFVILNAHQFNKLLHDKASSDFPVPSDFPAPSDDFIVGEIMD